MIQLLRASEVLSVNGDDALSYLGPAYYIPDDLDPI